MIGPQVAGGRYGEAPSLDALDARGNLVHTVDYRSLYASLLGEILEADAASILAGSYERLSLVRSPRADTKQHGEPQPV